MVTVLVVGFVTALTAAAAIMAVSRRSESAAEADGVESGLFAGKIPYIRSGSGPRHAVILLGGTALIRRIGQSPDRERYVRQIRRLLPPDFRMTLVGYEDVPPTAYTLDTIAQDAAALIGSEIGRADVVMGLSFGGFVAQHLAANHPERLDRLVLLVSGHRFSWHGWEAMQRQFAALDRGDLRSLMAGNVLLFRRPWFDWLARARLWTEGARLSAQCKDPTIIRQAYGSLFSEDFLRHPEIARHILAPTLVIGGTADQFFGAHVFEETAKLIPGARLALFEGETHMLPIERSADVAKAIEDFLSPQEGKAHVPLEAC
ncbi:alpha/beta fold hydrolase [Microvirga antarctica]|uniref:alpha/beta fold hydrolase n=1 Tax=Microvirga antarctica TaxID=2819233 RepID=UPI001B306210|nr:alpha/beta hydrolase [Microvirga antarctica]